MGTDHIHRVCTFKEAEAAIRRHDVIYVNHCFCRTPAKEGKTSWEYCGHPTKTCMGFHRPKPEGKAYEYWEITQDKALKLFEDWKASGNFFRFMEDEAWICFCCACGCQWFRDKEGNKQPDTCLKSGYIEKTNREICNLCGDCVPVCAYGARSIDNDEMIVDPERCYGCSACEFNCPEDAITMVGRGE